MLATGCAVHEGGFESPAGIPASFAGPRADGMFEAPRRARWWTSFDDPALDRLVDRALSDNFDLAALRARLAAARAVIEREESVLLPSVDYSLFAERGFGSRDTDRGSRYGAALLGSYQVDVWRQNLSAVAGAEARAAIARHELAAAAIALSARIAATWYELVEQRSQARVLEAQIANNEKVLTVVRTRFGGGVVRASDVLRQQRLLESTREQYAAVGARIETLEHALLVLTGRSPTGSIAASTDDLPELPPKPELGVPAGLVQRRPDVRAALAAIRAADADVAVAVAALYPSIRITADASTVEEQLAALFDDWSSLVAIDVLGPLFDGGRRSAEIDRAEAAKAVRVQDYARTVLIAFRQVVDALELELARSEQIRRLELQLDLAARTSERLNREYLNGDISYIDVLQALTTEQRLQRDLLSTRLLRILHRIDLYAALAGGWDDIGFAGAPPAEVRP